jgi:hypothetical protein
MSFLNVVAAQGHKEALYTIHPPITMDSFAISSGLFSLVAQQDVHISWISHSLSVIFRPAGRKMTDRRRKYHAAVRPELGCPLGQGQAIGAFT